MCRHTARALVAVLAISAISKIRVDALRLIIPDGGYARLFDAQPHPLQEVTLSAWVNITNFPLGVAPVLTYLSQDASTQMGFFLRHDGLGVLWGGPNAREKNAQSGEQVDRRPRLGWILEKVNRIKRGAVDYSMGLGDIENIMPFQRHGRSDNAWSPVNFVDITEMGVPDLIAMPSEVSSAVKPREVYNSHSIPYNEWTNVPYELNAQETSAQNEHSAKLPEIRIITEPSGENDFVYFNWNTPSADKQKIPPSPNEWSPLWDPQKEGYPVPVPHITEEHIEQNNNVEKLAGVWKAEVSKVNFGSNQWNPLWQQEQQSSSNYLQPPPPPLPNIKDTPPKAEVYTTTATSTTLKAVTEKPTQLQTTIVATTRRPARPPVKNSYSAFRYTNLKQHSNRTPSPISTTKVTEPLTVTNPLTSNKERIPLWKLINPSNKASSQKQQTTSSVKSVSTTTRSSIKLSDYIQPPTKISPKSNIQYKKPESVPTSDNTQHYYPANLQAQATLESVQKYYPVNSPRISTTTIMPTPDQPYKVSKWQGKQEIAHKKKTIIGENDMKEFMKIMENVDMVDKGNKAVVYSVPIIDENAFEEMYKQYQQQVLNTKNKVNLDQIYKEAASKGEPLKPQSTEEEQNENRLITKVHNIEWQSKETPLQHTQNKNVSQVPNTAVPSILKTYENYNIPDKSLAPNEINRGDTTVHQVNVPDADNSKQVIYDDLNDNSYQEYEENIQDSVYQDVPHYYDELYQPVQILVEEPSREAFYQQPERLYHNQLPPYLTSDKPQTHSKTEEDNEKLTLINVEEIPPQITNQEISESALDNTPQLEVYFRKFPFAFEEDKWYHLAFTWSAITHEMDVYVNGQQLGTLTDVMPRENALPANGILILGRTLLPDLTDFDETSQLTGEISGVSMWGKKLEGEDIQSIYKCSKKPNRYEIIDWYNTTMRLYNDAYLLPANAICGGY